LSRRFGIIILYYYTHIHTYNIYKQTRQSLNPLNKKKYKVNRNNKKRPPCVSVAHIFSMRIKYIPVAVYVLLYICIHFTVYHRVCSYHRCINATLQSTDWFVANSTNSSPLITINTYYGFVDLAFGLFLRNFTA